MKTALFSSVLLVVGACAIHVPSTPDAPTAWAPYEGTDVTTLAVVCLMPELAPGRWDCQPLEPDPTRGAWCGQPDGAELRLVGCSRDNRVTADSLSGCVLEGELDATVTITDRVALYRWADGSRSLCDLDARTLVEVP